MMTVLLLAAILGMGGIEAKIRIAFPEPTAETRPWGICHLMGNAVEKAELAKEMRRWSEAGLGGVRFVPIYAAKDNDGRNIATMSPEFISLLKDANALAVAMLRAFVAAAKEKRPMSEGFMLQRRASRDAIETYIKDLSGLNPDDDGFDAQCAAIGVNRVVRQGITITKTK